MNGWENVKEETKDGKDKKKLRTIKRTIKVKPVYKNEGDKPATDEAKLVRNYIDGLDMDYIAWRSRDDMHKGKTGITTVRLPDDLMYDIEILIDQKFVPFRTKSEFIRGAIHIYMNYWGGKGKSSSLANKLMLDDLNKGCEYTKFKQKQLQLYKTKLSESLLTFSHDNDVEINEFIEYNIRFLKSQNGTLRRKCIESFLDTIKEHGIDPEQYIEELREKDEEVSI